jgi:polysaccharide deacetylase family protein (PEP-CTERM system associated)
MLNAFTVDVEEYFHPTELQADAPSRRWRTFPSRLEDQIRRILDLLHAHNVSATFFILGWIANRQPGIVRLIASYGHEIGCHSNTHRLVYTLSPAEFREDTNCAVAAIEDACGISPRCYRAPSYSITDKCLWAFDILAECNFSHDSSVYPICHDRYGIPGFSRHATIVHTPSGPIQEIPPATVQLSSHNIAPIGGGAYFRLLPYRYTAAGIRRVNEQEGKPVCMYVHPWEIDPKQPRIASGFLSRLRTYAGLGSVERKLSRLLADFRFRSIREIYPAIATGGSHHEISSNCVRSVAIGSAG